MAQQEQEHDARAVVIGGGPDALRAAATLAHLGRSVLLLQTGQGASGLRQPDLPLDTGRFQVEPGARAEVEAVLGSLVDAPEAHQGLALGGRLVRLPMSRLQARRLLPIEQATTVGRSWARTRLRNEAAELIGGGQEERTYRDWVVRRMGEPAWHHLYRSYAERRWGAACDELSVSVARVHHTGADEGTFQVVGGGAGEALAHAASVVEASGEIRTGVSVRRLRVDGGKVVAVETEGEEIALDGGQLWLATDPVTASCWLGDEVPEGFHVDAQHLRLLPRVQVMLRGPVDGLPHTVHVLDEGTPYFRLVTPYGLEQAAIFHATFASPERVPTDSALVHRFVESAGALGLGEFDEEGARVEVLDAWEPCWLEGTHARLRRVQMRYRELGILAVGRGGAFAPLDPAEEIAYVSTLAGVDDPDQRELHRVHASPPVSQSDLRSRITRFIER